jgi:hypothetical protein
MGLWKDLVRQPSTTVYQTIDQHGRAINRLSNLNYGDILLYKHAIYLSYAKVHQHPYYWRSFLRLKTKRIACGYRAAAQLGSDF